MSKLKTDSPLSRRIARSFLQFLNSVEPSAGVDSEALDVAKDCLADVFNIDQSSLGVVNQEDDSLIDIFTSRQSNHSNAPNVVVQSRDFSDVPIASSGKDADVVVEASGSKNQDKAMEQHSPGRDELFGQFFGALESIHYFQRMADGNDDQSQLDRATGLFHNAVEEMQRAGCQTFDRRSLAETFKSQGNKAMQSKLYEEAIELYTFAIALFEDNAVYYCNRAAAYTQINRYAEAVRDCLRSIEINPSYSKAYSRLGFAYYAQGKYRDAIDKGFIKALQLDPNNESVKENIRVAEQKLREEYLRGGFSQSSTSTSDAHGGAQGNNSTPPPFSSMPFNMNGLPFDISSMLANMTGNVFPGQPFANGTEGPSETGADNEARIRIEGINLNGGNINLNVNDLPEDLSGAFRSMMGGIFPGNQQQNDGSGRSGGQNPPS